MLNRKHTHSSLCFVSFLFWFVASGHETFTVKSNAVTYVESRDAVPSEGGTRWRRSLSEQEIDESTSIHNTLRRLECAADMQYMKWNSDLASMAQEWANGCNFDHGQPDRKPSTLPYDQIGQNLYATTGQLDITSAISSFYDEKQYYDYDSLYCKPGQQCGHYTQVVWASSREVGCATSHCSKLLTRSTPLVDANYLVCNYGPAGNYVGHKPYQKGKACSKCGRKGNWCNEGLCNSDCSRPGPGCVPNATEPLACTAPPPVIVNHAKSLSFVIATVTLATTASLTMLTIDFLR